MTKGCLHSITANSIDGLLLLCKGSHEQLARNASRAEGQNRAASKGGRCAWPDSPVSAGRA